MKRLKSIQQTKIPLMTPEKAEKIINEYGLIIEKKSSANYIWFPETGLPYTKEEIKEAIKIGIKFLPKENEQMYENLKTVYVMLADFIPDEKAKIMITWLELITSGNYKDIPQHILEKGREIMNTHTKELEELHTDINSKDLRCFSNASTINSTDNTSKGNCTGIIIWISITFLFIIISIIYG